MARTSGGPKCPDPKRLNELINEIESQMTPPGSEIEEKFQKQEEEVINALDWLATFLENRTLYHKKQTRKRKIMESLLKEHGLTDEVNSLTDDAVFKIASGEAE